MWISLEDIQDFYSTEIGPHFAQSIRTIIEKYNDETKKILSIGYNNDSIIPTMIPAKQGLVEGASLVHDDMLPVANNSIDVVLVIHTLEYSVNVKLLLDEVYRILKSYGNAIFIFPNLYANLVLCHHIFKQNKCEARIKRLLKQHNFVINNTNYLSPFKQLFSGTVKDIISVINTQKQQHSVISQGNKAKITAKA